MDTLVAQSCSLQNNDETTKRDDGLWLLYKFSFTYIYIYI